jgi:5-methylcytosine-specific restriction endonuclease McrA
MSTKHKIPKALREQVWLVKVGRVFETKCTVAWCTNKMTVFDYQCGHNVPESKGGPTTLDNIVPICARCNVSMGNQYSIDEWNAKFATQHRPWWRRIFGW